MAMKTYAEVRHALPEAPAPIAEPSPTPPVEPNRADISEPLESFTERFVSPCPLPSDREREILTIVGEEAAEIGIEMLSILAQLQIRASKASRFGLEEVQPGQLYSNRDRLSHEVGDLLAVLELAEQEGLLCPEEISIGQQNKRQKLAKFMQTEPGAQEIA